MNALLASIPGRLKYVPLLKSIVHMKCERITIHELYMHRLNNVGHDPLISQYMRHMMYIKLHSQ